MIYYILDLDTRLLLLAQGIFPDTLRVPIIILAESIVIATAILLVYLWIYGVRHGDGEYKKLSLRIFFTIILTFLLYLIINLGVPQWRPGAMEVSGSMALIPHPTDNSFPSGHALFSGATLVGLWRFFSRKKLFWIFVLLALITGICRIAGGVHYLGDVLGGLLFGFIGALFLSRLVVSRIFEDKIYPFFIRVARWIKL